MTKHSSSTARQQNGKKPAKAASAGRQRKPKVSAGRRGTLKQQQEKGALEEFKSRVLRALSGNAEKPNGGRSALEAFYAFNKSRRALQAKTVKEFAKMFQEEIAEDGNVDDFMRVGTMCEDHYESLKPAPKKIKLEENEEDYSGEEEEVECLGMNLVAQKFRDSESETEDTDDNDSKDENDEDYSEDSHSNQSRQTKKASKSATSNKSSWNFRTWSQSFKELEEYQQTHGHCNVQIAEDPRLHRWVYRQKRRRHGPYDGSQILNYEQVDQLNSIGFDFHISHRSK